MCGSDVTIERFCFILCQCGHRGALDHVDVLGNFLLNRRTAWPTWESQPSSQQPQGLADDGFWLSGAAFLLRGLPVGHHWSISVAIFAAIVSEFTSLAE